MIKLKDILKEDKEIDKFFGKVAFGSDRALVKLQGLTKFEPDTEYERQLLRALESWASSSDDRVAWGLFKNIRILKKAAKVFPRILKPDTPNGTEVYRGLQSPSQTLLDEIAKTKKEDWEEWNIGTAKMFRYHKPVRYVPHLYIQSWSSEPRVAFKFFSVEENGIMLSTKQNDDFFFNQKLIFHLYGLNDEKEILHFGQVYKEDVYINILEEKFTQMFGRKKK